MPLANVESGMAQISLPLRMISKEPFSEMSTVPTHSVAESRRSQNRSAALTANSHQSQGGPCSLLENRGVAPTAAAATDC